MENHPIQKIVDPAPINEAHHRCLTAYTSALDAAIECGALLADAKIRIGRGNWKTWLTNHFEATDRIAQMYMRLWKHRAEIREVQKRNAVSGLSIREALKLVAEPKPEPDETNEQEGLEPATSTATPEPGPSGDPSPPGGSGGVVEVEEQEGTEDAEDGQEDGEDTDDEGLTPSTRLAEAIKAEVRNFLAPGDMAPAVAAAVCESVAAWIRGVDW